MQAERLEATERGLLEEGLNLPPESAPGLWDFLVQSCASELCYAALYKERHCEFFFWGDTSLVPGTL